MSAGEKEEILVVDDQRDLAHIYADWLSDSYEVKTAYRGSQALQLLEESTDIVLLDRRLPQSSGKEILEEIRSRSQSCRIAMLTAVKPDFDIIEMGFDDYLVKPVMKDDLRTLVDRLLIRSTYDEKLREYFALVSKKGIVEAMKNPAELAESREYEKLQHEIDETARQVDTKLQELEKEDFQAVLRDLTPETQSSSGNEDVTFPHSNSDTSAPIHVLYIGQADDFDSSLIERSDDRLSVIQEPHTEKIINNLENANFECVISEFDLSETTGLALLEDVREEYPDLPFVVAPAEGSAELAQKAISKGATDYIRRDDAEEFASIVANEIVNAVHHYRNRERVEDLKQIRNTLKEAHRILNNAESRFEIEQAVCNILSDIDDFAYAWVGEPVDGGNSLHIRASAGEAQDVTDIKCVWNETLDRHPAHTAIRTSEPYVSRKLPEESTGLIAGEGFESCAAIPIEHQEQAYGVLMIYSRTIPAFDGSNLLFLEELVENVAQSLYQREVSTRWDRLRRIVGNLPIGVYRTTFDSPGSLIDVNDAFVDLLGASSQEKLLEHSVRETYEDPSQRKELLQQLEAKDVVRNRQLNLRTLDGDTVWVLVTAMKTSENGEEYIDGVMQDITTRIERQQELQCQNQRLEEFASIISHDLRNPLNIIKGSVELEMDPSDPSPHLEKSRKAAIRMEHLIEDVLAVTQEEWDIDSTTDGPLKDVAEDCWKVVETKEVSLEVTTDQTIRADRGCLRQLFENLYRNAVDHGSDTVTVGPLENGFYVADDGPGIPENKRDQVWDQGYTSRDSGNGLGLYIVKQVVDAHGWDVSIATSQQGGAKFEITGVE